MGNLFSKKNKNNYFLNVCMRSHVKVFVIYTRKYSQILEVMQSFPLVVGEVIGLNLGLTPRHN